MQQAVEELFRRLVLGGDIDREGAALLARSCGFDEDDAASLDNDFDRLLVYRALVRATLRDALEVAIPRTVARLGAHFDAYFDRFLKERPPQSHYLRDVTTEFLDFCAPLFALDAAVPGYAMDLARHEALRIQIAAAEAPELPADAAPLDLSAGVRLTEASAVVRYAHAVHLVSEDIAATDVPARVPTALFVYRSPDDEVRYLELTPLAAAILERLHDRRESLGNALTGACADHGVALEESVLSGAAQLLSDLAERGALLGRRESGADSLNGDPSRDENWNNAQ